MSPAGIFLTALAITEGGITMTKLQRAIRQYKEAVSLKNVDLSELRNQILRLGAELGFTRQQIEAVFMIYA